MNYSTTFGIFHTLPLGGNTSPSPLLPFDLYLRFLPIPPTTSFRSNSPQHLRQIHKNVQRQFLGMERSLVVYWWLITVSTILP